MESYIKVKTSPNIIGGVLKKGNDIIDIRYFEVLDFNDPEPDLDDKAWLEKYGDTEYVYEVLVRHPETKSKLNNKHIYRSLESVERILRKKINTKEKV